MVLEKGGSSERRALIDLENVGVRVGKGVGRKGSECPAAWRIELATGSVDFSTAKLACVGSAEQYRARSPGSSSTKSPMRFRWLSAHDELGGRCQGAVTKTIGFEVDCRGAPRKGVPGRADGRSDYYFHVGAYFLASALTVAS